MKNNCVHPLSAAGEERVNVRLKAGRSGESMRGAAINGKVRRVDSPCHSAQRRIGIPLQASRKEGKTSFRTLAASKNLVIRRGR
jgi:hypothetical protein